MTTRSAVPPELTVPPEVSLYPPLEVRTLTPGVKTTAPLVATVPVTVVLAQWEATLAEVTALSHS